MYSVRQKLNLDKFHAPDGFTVVQKRLVFFTGGSDFVECDWRNGNGNRKVGRRKDVESSSGT